MRLNSHQIDRALSQFEAQVLPEDHPAVAQLNGIFGDHTFFIDQRGVNVLEPVETSDVGARSGEVVSLADWTDSTFTALSAHEPESTGVVVVLADLQH